METARLLSAAVRVTDAARAYLTELKLIIEFQATGIRGDADVERMQRAIVELEHAVEDAEAVKGQLVEGGGV